MKTIATILLFSIFYLFPDVSLSQDLISDEIIRRAKKETNVYRLKNKIPVIYRKVAGSDIVHMKIIFETGTRDLGIKEKPNNSILFDTMPMAGTKYNKQKVFETTEKYSISMSCAGGIQTSSCDLGTINDYWAQSLDLFADIVTQPSLSKENIQLNIDRSVAGLKSEMSDPESYANNTVNTIFYPKSHPFYSTYEELIKYTPGVTQTALKELHKQTLSADNMTISVVGSLSEKQLVSDLNDKFGAIPSLTTKRVPVDDPPFKKSNSYAFDHREIPTAYIRIKFNGTGVRDEDAVATQFMTRILSEELAEEIRTKQSLSYSVFAYMIQFDVGIGVIGASTSKPKQTLAAIRQVVKKFKNKLYTRTELDEHKTIYTTKYYLTQEEHSSLAGALANSFIWHGTTNKLYEMPKLLARITPKNVQDLAKKLLKNFRIGVVYDEGKFKKQWADQLVKYSTRRKG